MIARAYLRALVASARAAHPYNARHRRAWIEARMYLDARGLSCLIPIGRGQPPASFVRELSRWERAARMVC